MRWTFLVRLGIIVNAGLALTLLLSWVSSARRGEFWRGDFSMFYTGFAMVRDGHGAALYDFDEQLAYQRDIVPERGPDSGLLPFNYPPHTAVPAFVLSYLSREVAFYTWSAIQLGLLGILLRQLLTWTCEWSVESRGLLVTTVLAFPPLFASFQLGQVSLLVLVCLTGMAKALESYRPLASACWFVVATIKPQLALVPALIFLYRRGADAMAIVVAGALLLVWAGLTCLVIRPTVWLDWVEALRHSATVSGVLGIYPERMYNLKGLLFGLLGPERLGLINRLSTVAMVAGFVTTLVLWARGPFRVEIWRLKLALCLQLGLLTNLHFNPADAVVFVLPAVLYLLAAPRDRYLAATSGVLVLCPLLFYIDCYLVSSWPLGIRPFFVAMVTLAVVMGWSLQRSRWVAP